VFFFILFPLSGRSPSLLPSPPASPSFFFAQRCRGGGSSYVGQRLSISSFPTSPLCFFFFPPFPPFSSYAGRNRGGLSFLRQELKTFLWGRRPRRGFRHFRYIQKQRLLLLPFFPRRILAIRILLFKSIFSPTRSYAPRPSSPTLLCQALFSPP